MEPRRLSHPPIYYVGSIFVLVILIGMLAILVASFVGAGGLRLSAGLLFALVGAALLSSTAINNAIEAPAAVSFRRSVTAPATLVSFGLALLVDIPIVSVFFFACAAFSFIFWLREILAGFPASNRRAP